MRRRRWRIAAVPALASVLHGCAFAGSTSLGNGRSTYNAVINATEDEQVLSMLVSRRYDETFGMLAVASVTASLRAGASVGAQAGIGASSGYAGNLVPFSAGAAYEENPTISYVPLRGEQFVARLLAPLSAEQVLLLGRMSTPEVEVLRLLVRRANGLPNPLYAARPAPDGFDRFVDLYASLREQSRLDVVRSGVGDDGGFEMLLHDYAEDASGEVAELLRTLGIRRGDAGGGSPIAVPLRFGVGARSADGLDLETPSALEVVQAAAAGVRVPDAHLSEGVARPVERAGRRELLRVHASRVLEKAASASPARASTSS